MHFLETLDIAAPLRVLLRNHQQLLGDRLGLTALVRDLKTTYPHWQIYVSVADGEVWRNNPHIAGMILPGQNEPERVDFAVDVGPFCATQASKWNGQHFMRAWTYGFTRITGIPVHPGPIKADIHLSEQEKQFRPVAGHYWLFNPDTNNMGSKRWPADRWRDLLRSLADLRFIQVGLPGHCPNDYSDEPNVLSLVGRTSVRELFALVAGAEGCVSLISSLMHVAAAFDKPCVVLAGGREPDTFEKYPNHYYLSRVGMLPCCRDLACWKNSIAACKDQVATPAGPVARCMTTIMPADVKRGIELYYEGGRLAWEPPDPSDQTHPTDRITVATPAPVLRIVTNGKCFGGAERSCAMIARMFREKGWQVELATRQRICAEMAAAFAPIAVITDRVSSPCDVLLWYASDQVFDAHLPDFEPLAKCQAQRRVMALTYKLGKVPDLPWCRDWDQYLFLSSALRDGFLDRSDPSDPSDRCQVLAPPVDLAPFLAVQPHYDGLVRPVRHSSQGDNKWPCDTTALVQSCPDAVFSFMPPPSWLPPLDNVLAFPHGSRPVPEFLAAGNVFLYLLPAGYTDQGPRVVIEAMAAGLPVICEARDGCADRVTRETGWFVGAQDPPEDIIRALTPRELAAKGQAARERARTEFDPWKWYHAIAGGL